MESFNLSLIADVFHKRLRELHPSATRAASISSASDSDTIPNAAPFSSTRQNCFENAIEYEKEVDLEEFVLLPLSPSATMGNLYAHLSKTNCLLPFRFRSSNKDFVIELAKQIKINTYFKSRNLLPVYKTTSSSYSMDIIAMLL